MKGPLGRFVLKVLGWLPVAFAVWYVTDDALRVALREWERWSTPVSPNANFGEGTRTERLRWFRQQLAQWAKEQHGTWAAAAAALGCDEKSLRQDAPETDDASG